MRRVTIQLLALALLTCTVGVARADKYPPGPSGTCTDSVTLFQVQNPTDPCHPFNVTGTTADTVYGVGGIVTGFDKNASSFAFYFQNNAVGANGAPWRGIDVFTEGTNLATNLGLVIGDSVVVSGKLDEFQGGGEIRSLNRSQGSPNGPFVRKVSSGHHVPNTHVGTVAELQQKLSNPNAEQWEGCLVRINGPMRVVRISGTDFGPPADNRGMGQTYAWLVVDDTVCPDGTVGECDSVYVDGLTCATPFYTPPPVGKKVDMVQGLYDQRSPSTYIPSGGTAYRIQLRDGNDIVVATPPNLSDAFPIFDNNLSGAPRVDSIMVVFDRSVEKISAEAAGNYTLGSFRAVTGASRLNAPDDNRVVLKISNVTNGLVDGDNESITVSGVKGLANNLPMDTPQSSSFYNGVMTIGQIQAPDPGSNGLSGNPCVDRSAFAGAGAAPGQRLTYRGVATVGFGSVYYMQDGTTRGGASIFGPLTSLITNHQYLVAGDFQEFFEETEGRDNVYLRDEGVVTGPTPVVQTVSVLDDTTCDVAQNLNTGEDWEGQLVKVNQVKVCAFHGDGVTPSSREPICPGGDFLITTYPPPTPGNGDTMQVTIPNTFVFCADTMQVLNITGIERFPFGNFELYPRNDADIQLVGTLGTGLHLPAELSFSVYPNPSHEPTMSFALPKANHVTISAYDLSGRKVATIVNQEYGAGTFTRRWDGRDAQGNAVNAGMYFFRMQVGPETRLLRAVRLN
jgi:hypothetical protein